MPYRHKIIHCECETVGVGVILQYEFKYEYMYNVYGCFYENNRTKNHSENQVCRNSAIEITLVWHYNNVTSAS